MEKGTPSVWDGMPEAEFEKLKEWIRQCATAMGLRDWTFQLMREPAGKQSVGTATIIFGQRFCKLYVCDDWVEHDEKKETMAHELLHCHFKAAEECVYTSEDNLGKAVANVLFKNYRYNMEVAIDSVAREIARLLPDYPEDK